MDYKQKIRNRWTTDKDLIDWLDLSYPRWRSDSPDAVADHILFEVIGSTAHENMSVGESEQAEEWIMETYLGDY